MFPTEEMKSRLAYMNARLPDGTMIPRDHPHRRALVHTQEERDTCLQSGGGGLFAKPQEYCRKLRCTFPLFFFLGKQNCVFSDTVRFLGPMQR